MTDSFFPRIREPKRPVARQIAAGLLDEIDNECQRRVGQHCDLWRAFWQSSEATPQEIAAAMGTAAAAFFAVASINKNQIDSVAKMLGKVTAELGIPDECMTTPLPVTVNPDGSATIG